MTLAMRTRTIARQLDRLRPDWRYFEQRDELRRDLLRLANRLDHIDG